MVRIRTEMLFLGVVFGIVFSGVCFWITFYLGLGTSMYGGALTTSITLYLLSFVFAYVSGILEISLGDSEEMYEYETTKYEDLAVGFLFPAKVLWRLFGRFSNQA